jgi:WhiB family redox-sensing transcriptional regulator
VNDLLVHYPTWHARAACLDVADPDMFFPDSMDSDEAVQARALCRACPVAERCFGTAIQRRDRWGIHGGYGPKQRTTILRDALGRPEGRGDGLPTHCANNHVFTPDNTVHHKGRRACLTCRENRKAVSDGA